MSKKKIKLIEEKRKGWNDFAFSKNKIWFRYWMMIKKKFFISVKVKDEIFRWKWWKEDENFLVFKSFSDLRFKMFKKNENENDEKREKLFFVFLGFFFLENVKTLYFDEMLFL